MVSSQEGRATSRNDSHAEGVDYDPPYVLPLLLFLFSPSVSFSLIHRTRATRLWINGWDGRFILIRINANLSANVRTAPDAQGGTRLSVPSYSAVTLDPLELSFLTGGKRRAIIIRHCRLREKERKKKESNLPRCEYEYPLARIPARFQWIMRARLAGRIIAIF